MAWNTLISEVLHGLPCSSSYVEQFISFPDAQVGVNFEQLGMKWSLPYPVSVYLLQGFACKVSLFFAYSAFAQVPPMLTTFPMSLAVFSQDIGFVGMLFVLFCFPKIASAYSDQGATVSLTISAMVLYILYSYITMLPVFLRANLAFFCVTVSSNRRVH